MSALAVPPRDLRIPIQGTIPVPLIGADHPRIAPPVPAVSDVAELAAIAAEIGIPFMPWQITAGKYLEARAPDGRHAFKEVALVVGRQNGKTTEVLPLIVKRLREGRRIMHVAQNLRLPREIFGQLAEILSQDLTLFPTRTGRNGNRHVIMPRYGSGQEEIRLANGGTYRIVAATQGGARGHTNDDIIIDETREFENWDFIASAKPTMTTSADPQTIYLSNAGSEDSVVLNALRSRAGADPRLAYVEWSADPSYAASDRRGWTQANPALGHIPSMEEYLEGEYESYRLANRLDLFETEHLCRWVNAIREGLVTPAAWAACERPGLLAARPASMGVSMAPDGTRASAVVAWATPDGIGIRTIFDVPGSPIDIDRLARDMKTEARRLGVSRVGFDPLTDAQLARHFPAKEPISAQKYANASALFVALVDSERLHWVDSAAVSEDLTWTARKAHDESGSFQAVRANDEHPITASLAAIRAVWLASKPKPLADAKAAPSVMGF